MTVSKTFIKEIDPTFSLIFVNIDAIKLFPHMLRIVSQFSSYVNDIIQLFFIYKELT